MEGVNLATEQWKGKGRTEILGTKWLSFLSLILRTAVGGPFTDLVFGRGNSFIR